MGRAVRNLGVTAGVLTLALCAVFIVTIVQSQKQWGIDVLMLGIIAAIAGIAGLFGGVIANKKLLAAGVLMIIAAVLCIARIILAFSLFYIVSIILFSLSGFFAIMGACFAESPLYNKLLSPIQRKPKQPMPPTMKL